MKKLFLITVLLTNLIAFSTSNIQYLYGDFDDNSYLFDTKNGGKSTVTIEHYRTFDYGDAFMFVDMYIAHDEFKYHDDKVEFYGEFSPRISLSKVSSKELGFLFVNDIYLAFQYNGGTDYNAYLYGVGSSLNIPGFNVFDVNVYRKDQNIGVDTYQLSINYISKKVYDLVHINAFIDLTEIDFITEQQVLFDVANFFKTDQLYIGTEWHYYTQKPSNVNFNTDVKSNTIQAIIKYTW